MSPAVSGSCSGAAYVGFIKDECYYSIDYYLMFDLKNYCIVYRCFKNVFASYSYHFSHKSYTI